MKTRGISTFFLIGFGLGLASISHATSGPEKTYSAILLSPTEFKRVHADAKLPPYFEDLKQLNRRGVSLGDKIFKGLFDSVLDGRVNSSNSLCESTGSPCLVTTYLAPFQVLHRDGVKDSSVEIGEQLELNPLLKVEGEVSRSNGLRLEDAYLEVFKKRSYFDFESLIKEDKARAQKDFESLVRGTLGKSGEFSRRILESPRALPLLSTFYKEAQAIARKDVLDEIQYAYSSALLEVLDAIYQGADYQRASYPFNAKEDQIASARTLLSPSTLHAALSRIGGWPSILPLTDVDRSQKKGVFLANTKDQKRRKVKAYYSDSDHVIYVDFSSPFFENVYVLYHELWHVAWSHSEFAATEVAKLLHDTPTQTDDQLRAAIGRMISLNELLAIDQQNRLYHATSHLTAWWQGEELPSAKGWHDVYLNDLSRLAKKRNGRDVEHSAETDFAISPLVFLGHAAAEGVEKWIHDHHFSALDAEYWKRRFALHREHFEKIYFGSPLPETSIDDLALKVDLSKFRFVDPKEPVLNCKDALRIARLTGSLNQSETSAWVFSVPFVFQVREDGSPECAEIQNLKSRGIWLGNEGSHGGVDAMAAMDSQ